MLALSCMAVTACDNSGSNGEGSSTTSVQQADSARASSTIPLEPYDCSSVVDGTVLLAEQPAPLELIEAQLPLMRQMHSDTVLLAERFGIRADHLMVDGAPRLLLDTEEIADRCAEVVAAIDHPHLVQAVDWTQTERASIYQYGSPPWRRLIESEIGNASDDESPRTYMSMGTGRHGVTAIRLNSGEEVLAAELAARYGPLVELGVGNFAYDSSTDSLIGDDLCRDLPEDSARPGLSIGNVRRTGDEMSFDVTNSGPSTVHILPGRTIHVAETDGDRTATAFTGDETAEARPSFAVPPGESLTVRAHLALAACDPSQGSALPAGTYDAVLAVSVFDEQTWEGEPRDARVEVLVFRTPIEVQ